MKYSQIVVRISWNLGMRNEGKSYIIVGQVAQKILHHLHSIMKQFELLYNIL